MPSQAAADKKVKIKDLAQSGSSFLDVPAQTATLNHGGDALDDTNMATSPTFRSRVYGLRDWSVTITAFWDVASPVLIDIRDAWLNRTQLDVQYLPAGVVGTGFEGTVIVESINLSGAVDGLETAEISLQSVGAIAAAA